MIENFLKIEHWKLIIGLAMFFFFFSYGEAFAANRYWVGAAVGCDGTWADTVLK